MREKDPKSNISSTSYRSRSSRSCTIRVVVVGRVAHPVGSSTRGAIRTPVLRPLRLRHVHTSDNDIGNNDAERGFFVSF